METTQRQELKEEQVPAPSSNLPVLYPVQDILLPNDKLVSELYVRIQSGYAEFNDGYLSLENGTKVSFNTYFNSFYESYWTECTELSDIHLVIEFVGEMMVEVFRDTAHLGCNRIEWKKIRNAEMAIGMIAIPLTTLEITSLGGAKTGRIFLDIYARKKTLIKSIRLQTTKPPLHRPKLTLGICTFNRESYLLRNLVELEQFANATHSIAEIILVNQGAPFESEELKQLAQESGNIRLIEQGNLGGCGGFTRTMYESLANEDASYHVLMDDDAHIDARILANLEYFLSHLSKDIVVGGHMLDLLQPWMLYEAGAMVKPNSRIRPLHQNIDLRRVDALSPFLRFHHSDYNAWWFCAIPVRHMREACFPAPIFIRGDDMEYGIRLQEMGVNTVAMPGIAVWHEPFYAKAGSWQVYYDYRNRMILAAIYPHRFDMESPGIMTWDFFRALALHDYQQAALIIRAMEDFLKGPDILSQGAETLHADISGLAKAYAPHPEAEQKTYGSLVGKPVPEGKISRVFLVYRRLAAVYLNGGGRKRQPRLCMDGDVNIVTVGNFPYLKTNSLNTYRLKYEPSREILNHLLWKGLRVLYAYNKGRDSAAIQWRDQMTDLRSQDSWEQIFNVKA